MHLFLIKNWVHLIFRIFLLLDGSVELHIMDEKVEYVILMKLNLSWKVYLRKENSPGSLSEGALLAVGGRYDYLLQQLWRSDSVGYAHTFFFFSDWPWDGWYILSYFSFCISLNVRHFRMCNNHVCLCINNYRIQLQFAWITNCHA